MFVRDVMTTDAVTIAGSTSLAVATRIIDAHHIRRSLMVEERRLVGMASRDIHCCGNEKGFVERYTINRMTRVTSVKLLPRSNPNEMACKWEAKIMETEQWSGYGSA